jgi:hypothetical protein
VSQGAGESFLLILNIAVSTEKNSDIVISTDLGKSVSQGAGESFLLISNIAVSKKTRTLYKHGLGKVRVPGSRRILSPDFNHCSFKRKSSDIV